MGARRDWTLHNARTGEPFGCATSSWVMFNYKTRRLGRMPKDVSDSYAKLMPDPPVHCIDKDETRLKLPELPAGSPVTWHKGSPVYMDMNNHLNNTAYLTWILDSIPDDVLSSKVLAQYEVEYKAEGIAGGVSPSLCLCRSMLRTHHNIYAAWTNETLCHSKECGCL